VVDHELAQVGRDPVGVPHRPVQEVLHPTRAGLTGVFGDRPAVLAGQLGEHAIQERGEPAPGLHPAEPRSYPTEQLLARCGPSAGLYAVARGHRVIF
jgi:hypothetical protein